MRTWVENLWRSFSTGFWLVPGLFLLFGGVAAILTPWAEGQWEEVLPSALRVSPDTARATLTALCGAMFTVTGVVFSTTTVALSITSAQLGPRLLRNFLRQLVTQVTLGVCLATSVYCLVLLRQVDRFDGNVLVPQVSLLIASMLGFATLLVIVYFLHRVAHSMQAQNVVSDVGDDLDESIQRLFPDRIGDSPGGRSDRDAQPKQDASGDAIGEPDPWQSVWDAFDEHAGSTDSVAAERDGYLQAVDADRLMALATQRDVRLRLLARPGDYVREGQTLVESTPQGRLQESDLDRLRRAFMTGNARTTQQDVECAVNELVEVAVRALSPGINEPFTAISCVDRLSGALRRLAGRQLPSGLRLDEAGEPRVVVRPRQFSAVLEAAFDQIRQYSVDCVAVSARLLEAIEAIGSVARRREDRRALKHQAEMIVEGSRDRVKAKYDLEAIELRYERAIATLGGDVAARSHRYLEGDASSSRFAASGA